MNGRLQIGPVEWRVNTASDIDVLYSDPAYNGFWFNGATESVADPLVSIPLKIVRETRTIPSGEPLYWGGKNWAMWEDGEALIFCSGFYGQPAARYFCRLTRDFSSVTLYLDPEREGVDPNPYESPLRYPIDQILSWGLLAQCGGLILHSSVAVKEGVGWIFSGRSGAGKSTIAELCHQEGWQILNDDRVMVFKREGSWRVAGTPWHGSGRFSEADEVPLGGLFFIEKSDRDCVASMTGEDVRFRLLDVAAVPWFEDDWSQHALDAANCFAKEDFFYRLSFTPCKSAVDAVEEAISQDSEVPA